MRTREGGKAALGGGSGERETEGFVNNVGGGEREVGWRREERGTIREKGGGPGAGVAFKTKEKRYKEENTPPKRTKISPPEGHMGLAPRTNRLF